MGEPEQNQIITTIADDLLALVRLKSRISLFEASLSLKVDPTLLEEIVGFFVEARILDWEYAFTTPYIVPHFELKEMLMKSVRQKKDHSKAGMQYIDPEFLKEIKKYDISLVESRRFSTDFGGSGSVFSQKGVHRFGSPEKSEDTPLEKPPVMSKEETIKLRKILEKISEIEDTQLQNRPPPTLYSPAQPPPPSQAPVAVEVVSVKPLEKASESKAAPIPVRIVSTVTQSDTLRIQKHIDEIRTALDANDLGMADTAYTALWKFIAERGSVAEFVLKDIASINTALENLYHETESNFTHGIYSLREEIRSGGYHLLHRGLAEAKGSYESALKIFETLPIFFDGQYQRAHHLLLRFSADITEHETIWEHHDAVEDVNQKLHHVLGLFKTMRSTTTLSSEFIDELIAVYRCIPFEIYEYKIILGNHFLKLIMLPSVQTAPMDTMTETKETDSTDFQKLLSRIQQSIADGNLAAADSAMAEMWEYLFKNGRQDEKNAAEISKLSKDMLRLYLEQKKQCTQSTITILQLLAEGREKLRQNASQQVVSLCRQACTVLEQVPAIFSAQKSRIKKQLIVFHAECLDTLYHRSQQEKIKKAQEQLQQVIKTMNQNAHAVGPRTGVIREVVQIFSDIPHELFGHKLIISRQLLQLYTSAQLMKPMR